MKTKKMIRATFSAERREINITMPAAWSELTQWELHRVYSLLCSAQHKVGSEDMMKIFMALAGIRILRPEGDGFLCQVVARDAATGKTGPVLYIITPEAMTELLEPLKFIADSGDTPVRLERWHRSAAIDAQLHGLTFASYLQLENLFQGYISSEDPDALLALARILYPGIKRRHIDEVFTFNVLQWMIQVKALFARLWPNFFKPAAGTMTSPSMLEVMNAEIRALTGGDVTKEEEIFNTDCWRALTELDFKAKEAEEMKRHMAKSSQK